MTPPNVAQIELFKENPARGIYITREIDQSLFRELFPQILYLKAVQEPICLFIDSNGGSIYYADLLSNLIRCPNQSGQSFHLITVGVGYVASCAADLLALGDYSIIYPFCHVHYHGTRQQSDDITLQKIPSLAGNLRSTNEHYALRLAGKMFRRMTFLMMELATQNKLKNPPAVINENEFLFDVAKLHEVIDGFEKELLQKLADLNKDTHLIDEAISKRKKFRHLVDSLRAGNVDVKNESVLFKHLIDLESKAYPQVKLTELLPVIEDDYQQVRDLFFGKYQKDLHAIIAESDFAFLTQAEQQKYHSETNPKARLKFAIETVSPRLEPLWLLVVSLARTLQEGEFPMNAIEAYWLGLVDEVVGSGLPCFRVRYQQMKIMEQRALEAQQKLAGQQTGGT